jgi:hypothetical protein
MNQDCLKLTTYFAEHDKTGRRFLADALLDCYGHHQFATSVLLREYASEEDPRLPGPIPLPPAEEPRGL